MRVIHTVLDLQTALAAARPAPRIPGVGHLQGGPEYPVTLVPTMGNLHAGHLSLVRIARERAGLVVASVFVNPLQFGPTEDFATYPRTLARDCELLADGGCDITFAPTEHEMYPEVQSYTVHPPAVLADVLEGGIRPGFFIGVCTVVLKLFNIVRPDAAVFGKKDYQQLLVLRNMIQQLALPTRIVAGETIRDGNGLALSSRNAYLTDRQREDAVQLNAVLRTVVQDIRAGSEDWRSLEQHASLTLQERGWKPDYIAVRRQKDLREPTAGEPLVVLGAARLGTTRLIDNIEV